MRSFGRTILMGGLLTGALVLPFVASRPPAIAAKSYLGFDANDYPGDEALSVLRQTFSFISYWLGPPPGAKRNTWLGKRALLQKKGFGLVILFNGRESRGLKSEFYARQAGFHDADTAAKLARAEGFPARTVIFMDIEEGGRLSAAYHAYVKAWIDTLEMADFRAGVYCSAIAVDEGGGVNITSAKDLQEHLAGRRLVFWVYNDACPPSPGCAFPQTPPNPAKAGFPAAAIWQYAQSPRRREFTARCPENYAADGNCYAPGDSARRWFLDADVADSPDPSAPSK